MSFDFVDDIILTQNRINKDKIQRKIKENIKFAQELVTHSEKIYGRRKGNLYDGIKFLKHLVVFVNNRILELELDMEMTYTYREFLDLDNEVRKLKDIKSKLEELHNFSIFHFKIDMPYIGYYDLALYI